MQPETPSAEMAPTNEAPEDRERRDAWARGDARRHGNDQTASHASRVSEHTGLLARAFAALAENVRDYAIFLMDPDGVIIFWGEGARLIKWWTKDQAEGGHLRMLYPAGGAEDGGAEGHLRAAAERGEYSGEGQRIRSDGSTFWAGITLTALRDEDGTLLGFAKVTRDLTARRAADALLQSAAATAERARADAEAANAAKSGFLATMSHEIRTPLNAVLGYHDLLGLETDGTLTEGQRRYLLRASASARHLLTMITEVLDFSRIEADRMPIERRAFRIGTVVAEALSFVAPQARARGLELADAVSGYAAGLAVWGEEGRVRQILVNLLGNAIKFTSPRNGEPGRVTVSVGTATSPSPDALLSGSGPWVYVRVEDTGVGIAADRLQPIFEPFIQADMSLTRIHGGTGLGLAISRRLARLMGGDIMVRSEVGVGSTFFLWIAAAPAESLESGGVPGHGPTGEPAPTHTQTLHAVADALMAEMERLIHAYVARVRSDPDTPSAHGMAEAQVEDHLASFLADIAATLQQFDADSNANIGDPTDDLRDGTAIQHAISTRHGAQRARLGWRESEIHREFAVLREEFEAAIRRQAPRLLEGPVSDIRVEEGERSLVLLRQFLAVAERLSIASYRATTAELAGRDGAR